MKQYLLTSGILLILLVGFTKGEEPLVAPKPAKPLKQIDFRAPVPYGLKPVEYGTGPLTDPVTQLNEQLARQKRELKFDPDWGYLRDVLRQLEIPESSQLMVYSKTALNPRIINPENPRVVYFNDDVYLGWVPGAKSMELASLDPVRGTIFYELKLEATARPRFVRSERCLACHAGDSSSRVPGLLVRSFVTDDHGRPISGYSQITHDKPLEKRWGGWYVTGTHGEMTHLGNLFGRETIAESKTNPALRTNLTHVDQFFDTSKYLNPHSDLVAHLILDHQVQAHNLITRVSMEHQLGLESDARQRLVRYLLFLDEARLTAPVKGTTDYQSWFSGQGKRDSRGRSLKDFDLKTRLFQYRLSYLIYTDSFNQMPAAVRTRVLQDIYEFLNADAATLVKEWDVDPENFPHPERTAILQIVAETLQPLPDFWKTSPAQKP
ncbi:hypothetical protein Enr10x_43750 [Gimesia panareensis]|uniref:Cytochrome c domain-containing protein n=1 Tax=Gimesia panareensis TaxID=2527978 RepID=A0A517QBN9_9PLAN|nr:hypothetical protein [Gimesia panareensis]QDT29026.1 hypothetical protein Enr10x_43750 [Gimesia panareensis]